MEAPCCGCSLNFFLSAFSRKMIDVFGRKMIVCVTGDFVSRNIVYSLLILHHILELKLGNSYTQLILLHHILDTFTS